jgi:hypothetical protein
MCRNNGDRALIELSRKFDRIDLDKAGCAYPRRSLMPQPQPATAVRSTLSSSRATGSKLIT